LQSAVIVKCRPGRQAKGEYDIKVHPVINRFFPKLNVFKRLQADGYSIP